MAKLRTLLHAVRARPRLATSAVAGAACYAVLPSFLALPTRMLISWDAAAGLYLLLAALMMADTSVGTMQARARQQDEGAWAVLTLTVAAALISLAAIVLELTNLKDYAQAWRIAHLVLAALTIVVSWTFVHAAFAIHYAHEFYLALLKTGIPGLGFPGEKQPTYWDFAYFSFVIGTTSQTADVSINSAPLRRLALVHGVIAFFFNTTLLALTVNIAAGLL